jgi:hypothetical protein
MARLSGASAQATTFLLNFAVFAHCVCVCVRSRVIVVIFNTKCIISEFDRVTSYWHLQGDDPSRIVSG